MSIIKLKEANCKGCYKCIRHCDLKAIDFSNEQARIRENDCVLCGKCTIVCPQNAKQIVCDLPEVKQLVKRGAKLYASLAPSFVSAFTGATFVQMSAALKKLGFSVVEETAIGAAKVSLEYAKILTEQKPRNMITSCCPTAILLVEKYYPTLIPYLAPVVTPATAHAKLMKSTYGADGKVIFFGPCISKKHEAAEADNIDYVLLFEELKEWLAEEGITIGEEDPNPNELNAVKARLYPTPGGIIETIPPENRKGYRVIAIDGLDRCISTLESLAASDDISGYLIEMSACAGSCVQGPGMHLDGNKLLTSTNYVVSSSEAVVTTPMPATEASFSDMSAVYSPSKVKDRMPDEQTISAILACIGKTTPESMLNCGACGYDTCREKAIAVFQGKADLKMCMPYMREKAESMSNLILENTPEAVFVTDAEFNILEFNRASKNLFSQLTNDYIGLPIDMVINSEDFENVKSAGENIYYAVCRDDFNHTFLEISIIHAPNNDYIIIAKDVTSEQLQKEEIEKIRRETMETTQKVIDKQMRVAQEIASLLGETTGETKAALTKLKKSII